jgi:hypothetical protein
VCGRGVSWGGVFIGGQGDRGWARAVTTAWRGDHAQGEHGEAAVGQHWPRERAHRGRECQDIIMAWSWERTRPAALCPRWGDHGKKKKK